MNGRQVVNSTAHFPAGTGFVERRFEFDGAAESVWIFVPKNYDPRIRQPAIVFLHGLFEAGRDGTNHLAAGLGPVIAQKADEWPFITIFPRSNGTWKGEQRSRQVMNTLARAAEEFSIDEDRVILAGLSYGALGTWEIGARNPDRFAALVPISGHRATELVERLAMLPVWAFAFADDLIVASDSSEIMCKELAARGGQPRLTEFPGIGHDGWERAIERSDLLAWMLTQRRQPTTGTPRSDAVADIRE